MLDYLKEYTRWKEREDLDSDVREALLKMEDNDDEKKMWFSSDISFGTAATIRSLHFIKFITIIYLLQNSPMFKL